MHLTKIGINNYRNLDGVTISFSKKINYIVGENNIGKSNLILLFEKLFSTVLTEDDYANMSKKIIIDMEFELDYYDSLFFDDYVKIIDNKAQLRLTQGAYDSHPRVYDLLNNDNEIDFHYIKKLIFFKFSNKQELNLNVSLPMNNIEELAQHDFNVLYLLNAKGVHDTKQISLVLASSLLYSAIYKLKTRSYEEFDSLCYNENGKRILPIMIALDEPEIHLNPYLQRSLISYYKRLLNNEDKIFLNIIKRDFNIDELDSTMYIVTHSTEALVDDYKEIIRFYKDENSCKVISGINLELKTNVSKHLSMMFSDLKEAFFCKKAIIVEGITEYGAFKYFAKTLNMSLDEHGICLINAQGEGSISRIKTLLDSFKIENYQVYDGDVVSKKKKGKNQFYTNSVCFEMEIVEVLVDNKQYSLLQQIANSIPGASTQVFDNNYVKKTFEKIGYTRYIEKPFRLKELKHRDLDFYKAVYFTWLYKKKGLYLGRIIGTMLEEKFIPACYKNAIIKAVKDKNINSNKLK